MIMTNNNKKNILNNKIHNSQNATNEATTNEAADNSNQKNDKNLINRNDKESKFQD